jgi:MoaA/NifB/PqqE/SkfB family radical SAM enzyme
VHDFVRKLRQGPLHARIVDYVAWQRALRAAGATGKAPPAMPAWAPLSINLDLTTACNYACDHCIDWDTLNSGISYDDARLRASLASMAERGMRSVILIGGGEPTVYPGFVAMVRFLKSLDQQVAVVSNGSRNERIHEVVDCLDENDWVRLSLDAGTDATFQAMHRPKKPIALEEICAWIPRIKEKNARPRLGFSYIICWEGAGRAPDAPAVVENIDEIPAAARLAREHGFDYISFKPFLVRTEAGAEVMDPASAQADLRETLRRIRARVDEARELETADFAVVESTNLKVLEAGTWRDWTRQPRTCHMQALRQVLSPLGLWNCPAHRGVTKARIDGQDAYAGAAGARGTAAHTATMLQDFDASRECREVTCLYHETNWWIERAVTAAGAAIEGPLPDGGDYFL